MKVSLVQTDLHWENPSENLEMFDRLLADMVPGFTDIIVLPEMFSTGFTMTPEIHAEEAFGDSFRWMQTQAARTDAVVCGSLATKENGLFYNRLYWVRPDGTSDFYDKKHLFAMAGEAKVFTAGRKKLVTEWRGWKICPLICYDLRFPVWCRNVENYDLLIFTANWPQRRIAHWNVLTQARAVENQCYVVAVNRTGKDGNDLQYNGDSTAVDPMGNVLYKNDGKQEVYTVELSKEELTDIRTKLPFLSDRDLFEF